MNTWARTAAAAAGAAGGGGGGCSCPWGEEKPKEEKIGIFRKRKEGWWG